MSGQPVLRLPVGARGDVRSCNVLVRPHFLAYNEFFKRGTLQLMMTLDDFFSGQGESRELFEAVRRAVDEIGPAEVRVTKSQVAFCRRKAFAWVWMPSQYLRRKAAPLVLTLGFRYRNNSPRWKKIVEPYPGRFTHHLELHSTTEVDDEVRRWLREAWMSAE